MFKSFWEAGIGIGKIGARLLSAIISFSRFLQDCIGISLNLVGDRKSVEYQHRLVQFWQSFELYIWRDISQEALQAFWRRHPWIYVLYQIYIQITWVERTVFCGSVEIPLSIWDDIWFGGISVIDILHSSLSVEGSLRSSTSTSTLQSISRFKPSQCLHEPLLLRPWYPEAPPG